MFNTIIQRYVRDEAKDAARLMTYAAKLGVENKARRVIGVLLYIRLIAVNHGNG